MHLLLKTRPGKSLLIATLLFLSALTAAAGEIDLDGVLIPDDKTAADLSSTPYAAFQGIWVGTWDSRLKHVLFVDKMDPNGSGSAIYAIGGNKARNRKPRWFRVNVQITDQRLTVSNDRINAVYQLSDTGRLLGQFGGGSGFAVLQKQDFSKLISKQLDPKWSPSDQVFLETNLLEGGKPVRLETILYKPPGEGPFPLAIINHGSTGSGTDTSAFSYTWSNDWIAHLLIERGWIVAFPQRRGRGKSNGLYDEGFSTDRNRGYSCNTEKSLAGADRALKDVEAAIKALKERSDVKDDPVLIAGQSRGGILATAYAGRHPKQIVGVMNFVGGWMGDACPNATTINQSLFNRGAKFPKETLWIYGDGDRFYSEQHTRANFDAYVAAGGKGKYWQVTVPGKGNGHAALYVPPLWADVFSDYLDRLAAN